jgi:molybdopterin-dependent oxidoreductase alpha subunit
MTDCPADSPVQATADELSSAQANHNDTTQTEPEPSAAERAVPKRNESFIAHDGAVRAEPPTELNSGPVPESETVAGGIPAIVSTISHSWAEMGAVRTLRTLSQVNQKEGFDCPSCAWPDPDGDRSVVEFCENGAKAVAEEATVKRVAPEFFRELSVADLSTRSDYWLGKQGRLTHPMILREGAARYEEIEWDHAFQLIAGQLNSLSSPDEAIFYTSGRTSNEAAFLYQLFIRQFGTNNMPDCSNMCHESSGAALNQTIGIGKGTVTLEDFNKAQAIFIIGQNPGTNHPRMLTALQAAKRNGCRIVHVNPLPEIGLERFKHPQEIFRTLFGSGTRLADLFLQVRINGDVALLQGFGKELLEREAANPGRILDHQFVEEYTSGFGEYAAAIDAVSWSDITEQSGISRDQIREAMDIFASSERTIFCWAMGLTQHKNAVANIQEIVNVLLLRGQIGKPGAGVCPVRGHSNVQGDRTMGIWDRPSDALLDSLAKEFRFEPPRHHGYNTVDAIHAMAEGKAKVLIALGGNFLSATPDTEYTAKALRNCELTVHISTKLNRAHFVTGKQALILPCLGRTEVDLQPSGPQFVSMENSMGVVHTSRGSLAPASEHLLSEPTIVGRLAAATLGTRTTVNWAELTSDYDLIRDHISRVIPGCGDYNVRVRRPGGFYLPNGPRERKFRTKTGKANFTVHNLPHHELGEGQLMMMTIRSHDQFNTTIYGLDDRYRGIHNDRRVVFLNATDVDELGLKEGQVIDLVSHFEGEERVARHFIVVPYSIPRRCAATYFPEANILVPIRSVAETSNTPASKSVVISIRPSIESGPFDYDRVA